MIKNIFAKLTDGPVYLMGSTLLGIAGLAVILIKNTQNKDLKILQIKVDELIKTSKKNLLEQRFQDFSENELSELKYLCKNTEAQRVKSKVQNNEIPEKEISYNRYK